ncbi:hypothetical protein ACOMHN_012002 [Nucella lapillus]
MICPCSLPQSIIRDYGQRRLREIEAHRQLVKPLKQLGTAGHRLLNLRNSGSSAHNSTTASANTATESGTTANPSGIYAHARPGARGNCYMHRLLNDDIDPAYSGTADSNNVFQSVWSNFRRIFHRKVRRWKGSEGEEEGGSMGSGSRRRKGEGKQDWQLGDSGGKNRGRGGGGGGGGRMVRLCCRSEDSKGDDNRGKQKGYLPVPVSSSAVGSRDPVPKRVTRAFYNSPSGYTAVLTEEEETSRCSTPSSPTRPLMNAVLSNSKVIIKHDLIVSDASIKSASTGHTVVEVNSEDSNSAGEGPPASPSHPIFSLRPLDRPELRLINNSGEICDPCRPASAAGANVFFDRGEPSGGKNFHADDNGGEQDANLRANRLFVTSSIDRRCSEPVPQKRTQSESFLGSPSSFIRSSHTLPDCSPSGLDIFHGNSSMPHPCIRVESASTVDSDGSTDKVSLVDSSSSNFLHPCYQPPGQDRANEAEEEEEEEDDDEEDIVCRYRSNSAPSIVVAHAPPGSSVQLPLPYSGAALSTAGSSVAVGAVAASPTAQRVGLFQSNETITDSTARRASWIPAKDPLMHVHGASRDPDHVVSEQNEYLTSLLVQLQFSHELLHSRMSELETVYLSNRERLDRLGSVQADIMTLLHAQSILRTDKQKAKEANHGGDFLSTLTKVEGVWLPKRFQTNRPLQEHVRALGGLEMREDDIILLAYPKSGTHWLWEVMSMLTAGRAQHEGRSKELAMLEATEVERIQSQPSPRVLNSHLPFRLLPRGLLEEKVKVVQMYRNVKDVLVSLYFHLKQRGGEALTLESFERLFFADEAPFGSYMTYMKDMYEYRKSHPDLSVLLLSFEDTKEDPERVIQQLAGFLGVEASVQLCGDIAQATVFSKMKDSNAKKQHPNNLPTINYYRKGEVGDWKNYLTVAQSERLDAAMMELQSCDYHFRYEL